MTKEHQPQEQLEALRDIRSLMERSTRFLTLSGFSGVIAGLAAVLGIVNAYRYLGLSFAETGYYRQAFLPDGGVNTAFLNFFFATFAVVLAVSLLGAVLLTRRRAVRRGDRLWEASARRMVVNLLIPLVAGGFFSLALLYHRQIAFIPPAMLIFYGLALINASKYTWSNTLYLGIAQTVTGLLAMFFIDYGLLFWAFGFGILHIFYGMIMYIKKEE